MTLTKYNNRYPSTLDWLFDRFLDPASEGKQTTSFVPKVDVHETEKAYTVEVHAPGMSKQDFSLEVEEGLLTIRGERAFNREEEGKKYHLVESQYGMFSRSFRLPKAVLQDKIKATYSDGVLTVELPKDMKLAGIHKISVN